MGLKFMGHEYSKQITNEGINNNQVHVTNEVHINDDDLLTAIWALFVLILIIIIYKIYINLKRSCQNAVVRRVALNNVTSASV